MLTITGRGGLTGRGGVSPPIVWNKIKTRQFDYNVGGGTHPFPVIQSGAGRPLSQLSISPSYSVESSSVCFDGESVFLDDWFHAAYKCV